MAAITPSKRELPFIHRAWKTAVDHLPYGMGIKLSSGNGDTAVNGDHPSRAAKRRRIAEESPEAARAMPGRLGPDIADDVEKALRIEVLSITRADKSGPRPANMHYGNGSPEKKDIPVIKARCRVLLCEWGLDVCRVLHCDSQICNFKVFRDSDDVCRTARIYLPTPFQVPAEKLYIERQDGHDFCLGDHYLIRVEIESAGDPKWPPMDLLPKEQSSEHDSGPPRRWILSSQVIYRFEKGRATGDVVIRKRKDDVPLDLAMDMDLRWSPCHTATGLGRFASSTLAPQARVDQEKGVLAPPTNGHVNGGAGRGRGENDDGTLGAERDGMAEDEEDQEEATTPSRSLRTRGKQQNYNLKLLSDKARGKERKGRKQRKLGNMERKGNGVTWDVPLIGELSLESYDCIRCFAAHSSMEELKAHFKGHTDVRYTIDVSQAYIRIFAPNEDGQSSRSAYHGLPSPEDQESDIGGDVTPQTLSGSNLQNRHRSSQSVVAKTRDNRRLVPHIKQPLYDRLSKSLLEPGSLVDPPPVDDTWLVQKHREIIRDYTDVHQDEKEYIYEWDACVNRACVTSEPHLQDVYIRFVREKASWITASQNRATEWAKHLSYLKSRNALNEATITEALAIIRERRWQRRGDQAETVKSPSPKPAYRKSAGGCPVCGQPVRGPASLICSNLDCSNAIYHKDCIKPMANHPVDSRNWRCNKCFDEQKVMG
ncbi:hypothetical protein GGS20DRAFT_553898 [Poronia punctata]|nr:hypothetical protein GGS20DRAFT_553898 [Poronia punctata]